MTEKDPSADDQWKEKYNGCIREIDQLEIELEATKQSYINGIKRLVQIIPDVDATTQETIDTLQQSSKNQTFQHAERCLQALTDLLFKLEVGSKARVTEQNPSAQTEKSLTQFTHDFLTKLTAFDLPADRLTDWQSRLSAADNLTSAQFEEILLKFAQETYQQQQNQLQNLRTYFEQLLKGLPVTGDLIKDLNHLMNELESTSPDLDQLGLLFQSSTLLIKQMKQSIQAEQKQTEYFLQQLANKLIQINNSLGQFSGSIEETYQVGHLIAEQFEKNIASLRISVDKSETLEELKNDVSQGLDTFNTQFGSYQKKEQARHLQLSSENNKAMAQLAALEQQRKELSAAVAQERKNAKRDRLTALNNRWAFDTQLEIHYKQWQKESGNLVIAFFDIDHFKKINDTHGHKVGDQVLKAVASILKQDIGEIGFLARYGGEEFVAIFTKKTSHEVFTLVEKLRQNIASKKFKSSADTLRLTLSCGVAEYKKGDVLDAAVVAADQALYQAKDKGRNQTLLAK